MRFEDGKEGARVRVDSKETILAPGEKQDLSIAGKVVTITGTDREGVLLNGVQIKKDQSHIAR